MSILYFIRGKLNFPLTKRIVICEICSSQTKELLPGLRLNLDVLVLVLLTQLLKENMKYIYKPVLKQMEDRKKTNYFISEEDISQRVGTLSEKKREICNGVGVSDYYSFP